VAKSLELFDELVRLDRPRVVLSSSASLYATVDGFEVDERSPLNPLSPYARTKLMMEQILEGVAQATELRALILRHSTPVGSDADLELGVYAGLPSTSWVSWSLPPGACDAFTVAGTEHPTRDVTGIHDYVHVWDLAQTHVAAVEQFDKALETGWASQALS
jgi:UDP-glucose 4-epimerase